MVRKTSAGNDQKTKQHPGDGGYTSLPGGERVPKDHLRLEACGDLDELMSLLGTAKALSRDKGLCGELSDIQRIIIRACAEIASGAGRKSHCPNPVSRDDLQRLDRRCREIKRGVVQPREFVLPGANLLAAQVDSARAVARRAERRIVTLAGEEQLNNEFLLAWTNRLSTYLWLLARSCESRGDSSKPLFPLLSRS